MVADVNPPSESPTAKIKRHRINLALAGALLAQGMGYDEVAPKVGAKNGNSLRSNLAKRGVTLTKVRNPSPDHVATATVTCKVVNEATEQLQERFNSEIARQLAAIEAERMTYDDLPSRGQGRTATVKTLAETYRAVNGNPDSVTFSFGASVQSSRPELEIPQQVVNCGPELDITPDPLTLPVQVVDTAQDSGGSNGA